MSTLVPYFGPTRSRLIFAADLVDARSNFTILERIADLIDVIKVPNALALREGAAIYGRLSDKFGLPVFADLKIADVPHTSAEMVRTARENGAAAAMIHAFVGPDAILAALDAAGRKIAIIAQLELTSPGGEVFNAPITEDMTRLVSSLSVDGVQAPGNRPAKVRRIRQIVGDTVGIVCCGVGTQGGQFGDVLAAGADYAIVGRAIYNADDPRNAIEMLTARQ